MLKIFLSPIPFKFYVSNPLAIRISNFQYQENQRQNFLIQKGPPFGFFIKIKANFEIDLRGSGVAGHTSRCLSIIKVDINFASNMILKVASRSQFLAGLTAKLSNVPPPQRIHARKRFMQQFYGQNSNF